MTSKIKKVLQINLGTDLSTGRIAKGIQNILLKKGIQSYIAFGRGSGNDVNNGIKIGSRMGIYLHAVLTRLFDIHGLGSGRDTRVLIKKIEELNPDIVHLHNIHGYYLNIAVLFNYLKEAKRTVVWTFHDLWPITGHCAYFCSIHCDKWRFGCGHCPQKKEYPASILWDSSKYMLKTKKKLFSGVSNMVLVSPSEWLAGYLKQSFVGEYPIRVINNGIDTNIFYPRKNSDHILDKYGIDKNINIILGVSAGFKHTRKGFKYFVRLADMISSEYKICLIGIEKELIPQLPANIIGIEHTENVEELAQFYSAALVFCNPTMDDNFPSVTLEAMACGTPVVAFGTGGVKEQVAEGCGYIVDAGDIEGMYEDIKKIRDACRNIYAEKCTNRIYEMYRQEERFEDYLGLYQELTNDE